MARCIVRDQPVPQAWLIMVSPCVTHTGDPLTMGENRGGLVPNVQSDMWGILSRATSGGFSHIKESLMTS